MSADDTLLLLLRAIRDGDDAGEPLDSDMLSSQLGWSATDVAAGLSSARAADVDLGCACGREPCAALRRPGDHGAGAALDVGHVGHRVIGRSARREQGADAFARRRWRRAGSPVVGRRRRRRRRVVVAERVVLARLDPADSDVDDDRGRGEDALPGDAGRWGAARRRAWRRPSRRAAARARRQPGNVRLDGRRPRRRRVSGGRRRPPRLRPLVSCAAHVRPRWLGRRCRVGPRRDGPPRRDPRRPFDGRRRGPRRRGVAAGRSPHHGCAAWCW